MPRNTLVFVALLAVIAALLVGINIGRSTAGKEPALPTPVVPTPLPTLAYLDGAACGITFKYPNTLRAMESSGSGIILADQTNPSESVVVICQKDIPRVPLAPEKIETVSIPTASGSTGIKAKLYHDASQKDGTPVDKLIFSHPSSGLDVFVAGFGATYDALIKTVTLE